MITCIESYTCICENLECSPSKRTADALLIFRQFKNIFEETDKMMQDPVMQEICRHLPEIHFERLCPLDIKPVETLRKEYLKRSGNDLPEFLCHMAYLSTLRKDAEEARRTAEAARRTAEEKAKAGQKTADGSRGKDTDNPVNCSRSCTDTADILDAGKKQQELIDRFRKQCDEMDRKRKHPDAEGCTCGKEGCTCAGGSCTCSKEGNACGKEGCTCASGNSDSGEHSSCIGNSSCRDSGKHGGV